MKKTEVARVLLELPRLRSRLAVAALGLLAFAAPLAARAEPPRLSAEAFDQLPPEERVNYLREQSRDFQARRSEGRTAWFKRNRDETRGPRIPLDVRVERSRDGVILYSQPYDPKHEAMMLATGFHQARSAQEVNDRSLFEGRMYRSVRFVDTSNQPRGLRRRLAQLEGKNAELVLQETRNGSPVAVSLIPRSTPPAR